MPNGIPTSATLPCQELGRTCILQAYSSGGNLYQPIMTGNQGTFGLSPSSCHHSIIYLTFDVQMNLKQSLEILFAKLTIEFGCEVGPYTWLSMLPIQYLGFNFFIYIRKHLNVLSICQCFTHVHFFPTVCLQVATHVTVEHALNCPCSPTCIIETFSVC